MKQEWEEAFNRVKDLDERYSCINVRPYDNSSGKGFVFHGLIEPKELRMVRTEDELEEDTENKVRTLFETMIAELEDAIKSVL